MLLTREEMSFDFGGAKLDPVRDKELIGWMLNQFLYGEMTGIQVGHWLYDAPDVNAAKFLARQSLEEMQHVDNFLRMMTMMGVQPAPTHWAVRFLSTGMMGGSWAEHVALEMAQGEGFVLMAFYGVIDTLDHKPSVDILKRAVKQEGAGLSALNILSTHPTNAHRVEQLRQALPAALALYEQARAAGKP